MRSSITIPEPAVAVDASSPRMSGGPGRAVRSPSGGGAAADQRDAGRASHPPAALPGLRGQDDRRAAGRDRRSAFGPSLQAAVVTLTARNRISRRGMTELARDLFGVSLSTGTVDAICQRASDRARRPARPAARLGA